MNAEQNGLKGMERSKMTWDEVTWKWMLITLMNKWEINATRVKEYIWNIESSFLSSNVSCVFYNQRYW